MRENILQYAMLDIKKLRVDLLKRKEADNGIFG